MYQGAFFFLNFQKQNLLDLALQSQERNVPNIGSILQKQQLIPLWVQFSPFWKLAKTPLINSISYQANKESRSRIMFIYYTMYNQGKFGFHYCSKVNDSLIILNVCNQCCQLCYVSQYTEVCVSPQSCNILMISEFFSEHFHQVQCTVLCVDCL